MGFLHTCPNTPEGFSQACLGGGGTNNATAPESNGVTANMRSLLHTFRRDAEQRHPGSKRSTSALLLASPDLQR